MRTLADLLIHKAYLERISTPTANKAWALWLDLSKAVGHRLPVPSAGTGPDGQMFYSWDRGTHHLEAEISSSGTEFFYRNRLNGTLWGEEYDGVVSEELLTRLRCFVEAQEPLLVVEGVKIGGVYQHWAGVNCIVTGVFRDEKSIRVEYCDWPLAVYKGSCSLEEFRRTHCDALQIFGLVR